MPSPTPLYKEGPAVLRVDDSLERVREGLESRARRISGRVGSLLASHVGRPGKMLRARFCLHLGASLGVQAEKAEAAARALELVHNASLLHDDCVDAADTRRGEPTPNKLYGTTVALLLGDLAFSQGLEEAVDISPNASHHLVRTVREMTVGELQEEFLKDSVAVTLEAYMGIAARKTGALFEWAGNVLSELSPHPHEAADPPRLACSAGILLQIVDDIHDYTLPGELAGKARGTDIAMGRLNLPAVLAARDPRLGPEFESLWKGGDVDAITEFLRTHLFIEAARDQGREILGSMRRWIAALPVRPEAEELGRFVELLAKREF